MTAILATLRSKMTLIICVILTTLLLTSVVSNSSKSKELTALRTSYQEQVSLNERLSETNKKLLDDIKNMPPKYIKITKEVATEVCNGKIKQEAIAALPSKRKEVKDETPHVADVDDALPTDLKRLLK